LDEETLNGKADCTKFNKKVHTIVLIDSETRIVNSITCQYREACTEILCLQKNKNDPNGIDYLEELSFSL
jgi:hypothetical protein